MGHMKTYYVFLLSMQLQDRLVSVDKLRLYVNCGGIMILSCVGIGQCNGKYLR